jgi:CDP-2,3-bis-(O-geranylgeranyl)-sn-glycerol synthase
MFEALTLLLVANGTPVIVCWVLGKHGAWPVDANFIAQDGRPLLGESKTIRGILIAVCASALTAEILGLGWRIGLSVGALAMFGDLFSSFIKRRLAMPSGSQAAGLDQIPEALLPLVFCHGELGLQWHEVFMVVVLFWLLEVVLSRVLYTLHVRKQPW